MRTHSKFGVLLFSTASALAICSAAALGQDNSTGETVVVTGSRVISDAANSPTPLTVVSTEQLLTTTPSGEIADALNKLRFSTAR